MIRLNIELLQSVCDNLLRIEIVHTNKTLVCYYPESISLYSICSNEKKLLWEGPYLIGAIHVSPQSFLMGLSIIYVNQDNNNVYYGVDICRSTVGIKMNPYAGFSIAMSKYPKVIPYVLTLIEEPIKYISVDYVDIGDDTIHMEFYTVTYLYSMNIKYGTELCTLDKINHITKLCEVTYDLSM